MQNNKKYWLRGGTVGLIISIIILILILLSPVYCVGLSVDGTGCTSPQGIEAIIYNINLMANYLGQLLFYFVILPILICIFFGWLYGKIKNRNKSI